MALRNAVSPVMSAHRPGTLSLEFSTTRETKEGCCDLQSHCTFHAAFLALDTHTIEDVPAEFLKLHCRGLLDKAQAINSPAITRATG